MGRRIASYYKNKGFTMSRRGRLAVKMNEHPLQYWIERLAMDKPQIEKLLVFMGNHHVGAHGNLTPFYRLLDKNDLPRCADHPCFRYIRRKHPDR